MLTKSLWKYRNICSIKNKSPVVSLHYFYRFRYLQLVYYKKYASTMGLFFIQNMTPFVCEDVLSVPFSQPYFKMPSMHLCALGLSNYMQFFYKTFGEEHVGYFFRRNFNEIIARASCRNRADCYCEQKLQSIPQRPPLSRKI